jgi:MoaA/NifB/PqqE/SkfB family radical SAM enzyme
MNKTKRVKIVTGLKCNIQCVFCYYRDSLKAPNRSLVDIRKDLVYAKKHGIEEVDFSGGEPTVHPDLPQLISEAKAIGMKRVCIISNGFRLADRHYLEALKAAGLDEVLFSVHGPDAAIHDQITSVAGSFQHISEALANASQAGLMIRTNTVVNRINFEDLDRIGSFILNFHPAQVNFITVNDWCYAKHLVDKLMVTYSEMSPALKAVCDLLDKHVNMVNVRYIPFCFMKGYERFVCNHRQVLYDPYEWVPRVRARLEVQNTLWRYLGILGYGFVFGGAFKKALHTTFPALLDECIIEALRHWYYSKNSNCRSCSYSSICDGVEKTYAKKFGLDELCMIQGKAIESPYFFRKD